MSHIHVFSPAEQVVVHDRVLRAAPVEPGRALGFNQHATGSENGDLRDRRIGLVEDAGIIVMICNPSPDVLEISRSLGREAEHERGCNALVIGAELRAVVKIEICPFTTTDTEVGVPHARGALFVLVRVPFHEDSTRCATTD